jgi:two-component system, LytTR family, sensor histidine kinase AlgZ
MSSPRSEADGDGFFLPDFCHIRMVFAVVLVGVLLAFVLVLAPTGGSGPFWQDLALTSLFVQWVALTSAGLLCLARPWLRHTSNAMAGLIGYVLILSVTLVLSEAAYWLIARQVVVFAPPPPVVFGGSGVELTQSPSDLLTPAWHMEFLLRNLAISAIVSAVALRYFYVQHQWRTKVESEARARIQALQSRIRPHFLFNSMNTIASLARTQPALAESITEDLADLFRVSLGDASVPVPLARELEICERYLHIEEQRLGERLRQRFDVEALPSDALVPALILQPLLENAVYHGIEPATEGGVVEVVGRREGATLFVEIENPLPDGRAASARPGNQMAQENVRQRLDAFFGGRAGLEVVAEGERYRVRVRFPYLTQAP